MGLNPNRRWAINKKVIPSQGFLPDFNKPPVKDTSPPLRETAAPATETQAANAEISQTGGHIEKRIDRRVTVELTAELIVNVDTMDCTTIDLSAHGVKLKLTKDLFKNIRVNIANSGEISGEIMWKDDDYVGIRFDEDQSEIVNVLARVTS